MLRAVPAHEGAKPHAQVAVDHLFKEPLGVTVILGKIVICENKLADTKAVQLRKFVTYPVDGFVILPVVPKGIYIAEVKPVGSRVTPQQQRLGRRSSAPACKG